MTTDPTGADPRMAAASELPQAFLQATDREIALARALWQTDYLMHSVYLNLGKSSLPIYHEQQRRMREELAAADGELCNYVGPMSVEELERAQSAKANARHTADAATNEEENT
jgi:hypothetical protein